MGVPFHLLLQVVKWRRNISDHAYGLVIPFAEVTQVRKQNTAVVFADTIVLGTRSRQLVTLSSLRNRQVGPC